MREEGLSACCAGPRLAAQAAAPLFAKKVPQALFLNAQTLSGSSLGFAEYKKSNPTFWLSCFFYFGARRGTQCLQSRLSACGTATAPLFAKKVLQALFLNAQTLSGSSPNKA